MILLLSVLYQGRLVFEGFGTFAAAISPILCRLQVLVLSVYVWLAAVSYPQNTWD